MKSHNRRGSLDWGASSLSLSPSKTVVVVLSLLSSLPSSVLPFKAGHVEPVPGSAVMRNRGSSTTGTGSSGMGNISSRAAILQKLTSPRRGGLPLPYDSSGLTTASSPTGYYSQSQSMESHERGGGGISSSGGGSPFTRFPTMASPFASISSTIPSSDKHQYQRLHHYQRIQRQGLRPTAPTNLLAREEPSSLFTSGDGLGGSYYTTGAEATMSSVDIDRYSLETGDDGAPYKKQTATSVNSVVDASHSSPKKSSSSPSTTTTARSSRDKKIDSSSQKLSPNNSLPLPPTLLPPSYLSLATFRHDGTLEKSSGDILSRIAEFWRNLSKDVAGKSNSSSTVGNKSKASSASISSSKLSSLAKPGTYTKLASDESLGIDDYDTDDKANHKNNNSDRHHHHHHHHHEDDHPLHEPMKTTRRNKGSGEKSESGNGGGSGLQRQPTNKYISMDVEDDDDERSSLINTAKQQYLSLDDGEDEGEEDIIGRANNNIHKQDDDDHADHHQQKKSDQDQDQQQQHANSVDDVEDYRGESSVAYDFDNLSSDDTHPSFHEDLFHHTTGTITAVIKKDQFHEDLIGSGSISSRDEQQKHLQPTLPTLHKSEETARSSASFGSSGLGISGPSGGSNSIVKNLGDVKRAESDKIWSLDSHVGRNDLIESAEEEHDFYYGMTIGGFLKRELWTIPLFVLAALNMILIILFEVYVLCRARGQSRRHLFLGQMLLFGLFLCSFLALMFAVHPSIVGCFVGRLGVGITYSLIFSVLMVKCVFLLSLDTGIYLPTSYQGMLLFFAVLVQVAVDTQWVVMYPPVLQTVESGRSMFLQCGTSFVQLLYSLSYVAFLVLMVGFLAGRAAYKGVVENYRESVYILITAVVTVPVALSWTVAGWMLQGRHQDACVSFGLVAHSLTTFLIMFMPKGRQLASLDKEAVCFEDQEDQCSGYSPSFFHFKPTTKNYKATLWGDGNLYTTLEPTVSTINPNVFFHRNDFHSGMIY